MEGLGHHADGENALLFRGARNHRRGTGAGAPAHAGGDENHMGAGEMIHDLGQRLLGCRRANLGLRACAKPLVRAVPI